MSFKNIRRARQIVFIWLIAIIFQVAFPTAALALTSGPKAPEFTTFEPVATSNMVNLFSGDFNYNLPVLEIPGPDGGGYALSLSYHSGVSPEQEASWVGYGWNLNPGAINRTMRGIPDDYKDAKIIRYNKRVPNWTISTTQGIGVEFFGANDQPPQKQENTEFKFTFSGAINLSTTVRTNNYKGITSQSGFGLSAIGITTNINVDHNGPTFSASINPFKLFSSFVKLKDKENSSVENANKKVDEKGLIVSGVKHLNRFIEGAKSGMLGLPSSYGMRTFQDVVVPNQSASYDGTSITGSFDFKTTPSPTPVGANARFLANFNYQENRPKIEHSANGLIYSKRTQGRVMQDYFTEKSNDFSRRDIFLGIPFNSPDMFSLAGEGIQGMFRYHNNQIGHFSPSFETSNVLSLSRGIQFTLGMDLGMGTTLGGSGQNIQNNEWEGEKSNSIPYFQGSRDGYFKFVGDLGGETNYGSNSLVKANLDTWSNLNFVPFSNPVLQFPGNEFQRNSSNNLSSYIEPEYSLENNLLKNFKIINEDGNIYEYGIPIYNMNESSLQFGISPDAVKKSGNLLYQKTIYKNTLPDEDSTDVLLGEVKKDPYCGTFLLTDILTPDYIDSDNNGYPNDKDFGGWTRFHYVSLYNKNNPFHWRIPYNGLSYQKNKISDTKDDLAGVSFGDKEVYLMGAIETKTHYAFFVTNKSTPERFKELFPNQVFPDSLDLYLSGGGLDRQDALGASRVAEEDPASENSEAKDASQRLEYLEKIVLVSKMRMEQPLKVTHFEYDYMLCKGLPNYSGNGAGGKLTLKRVYFEYEGKFRTRISPYEFHYSYKNKSGFKNIEEYKNSYGSNIHDFLARQNIAEIAQNPNYSLDLLDAWGNIQFEGQRRFENFQKWPYQGKIDETKFDPAAWHLKWIKLPSGGEIHVNYEQKDYTHVQDKEAMGLVSLLDSDLGKNEFALNTADLGISSIEDKKKLVNKINNYYGTESDREKIYFKFLFNLLDNEPALDDCRSEYISGYAIMQKAWIDGTNIIIKLKGSDAATEGAKYEPRDACIDFLFSNFNGKFGSNCSLIGDLEPSIQSFIDQVKLAAANRPQAELMDGFKNLCEAILTNHDNAVFTRLLQSSCDRVEKSLSYLKVPLLYPKKGGGVRVKSLLLYNDGLESGDEYFSGITYDYKTPDGNSSGVATNEPSEMREENALVTFLPRKGQNWFSKITAGDDLEQTEGPIGESLLPSASVGHSRVVVRNIYNGKANTGFTVNEYYTAKDYPFSRIIENNSESEIPAGKTVDFTDLDEGTIDKFFMLPLVVFSRNEERVWATQGFRFLITERHGQPRRNSTYGYAADGVTPYLITSEEFTYYEPGEKVPVLQPDGTFVKKALGKEMDVAIEMKNTSNEIYEGSISLDVEIGAVLPIPPVYLTIWPTTQWSSQSISSHVISKVITYPTILKRVDTYKEGAKTYKEFIAFDKYTGKPLITKMNDEYDGVAIGSARHDGTIYKTEIPASYKYPEMGPKSLNSAYRNSLNSMTGTFVTYGKDGNPLNFNSMTWIVNKNVINAQVQTYEKHINITSWLDAGIKSEYQIDSISKFNNIWRPYQSFTYKDDVSSGNQVGGKVYQAGIMQNIADFNWSNPAQNDSRWLNLATVTKYSPNGNVLEERNILGYYNSAKYGYNFTLPILRAENAEYSSVYFNDFESKSSSGNAHSGIGSYNLGAPLEFLVASNYQLHNQGAWLKCWIRTNNPADNLNNLAEVLINNNVNTGNFEYVGRSGEWALYRLKIENTLIPLSGSFKVSIKKKSGSSGNVLIDDVRFQPFDSKMACYVYDARSFRLLALFDDTHFGLFYQYNEEGALIRKLVETENGLKTVTETQYNTPTQIR